MNRLEFIKFVIKKKNLDQEVFKKSLEIDNFPIAREVLNKIDGNMHTCIILESENLVQIRSAHANLIANLVNYLKDPLLKSETKKFLDDLVNLKILGTNFQIIKDPWEDESDQLNSESVTNSKKNLYSENKKEKFNHSNVRKKVSENIKIETNHSDYILKEIIEELTLMRQQKISRKFFQKKKKIIEENVPLMCFGLVICILGPILYFSDNLEFRIKKQVNPDIPTYIFYKN